MGKKNRKQSEVETELFQAVAPKLESYLKWRLWYFPAIVIAVFGIAMYFGIDYIIEQKVTEITTRHIDQQFKSTKGKIDSLYSESVTLIEEQRNSIDFLNDQLSIFLRQYELILSLVAEAPEALELSQSPIETYLELYSSLKPGEVVQFDLKKIGEEVSFRASLFKYDSVYLVIEIPTNLVAEHFKQLNEIGYMRGIPLPSIHPNLYIRAEAFFQDARNAVSDIHKVSNIILGIDKLYTLEYSILSHNAE